MERNESKVTGILLEAGTNELEVVEFTVGSSHYGINVAKVREIIRVSDNIVSVPDAHESLEGAINLRGKVIPIINLIKHLKVSQVYDKKTSRIIVCEFNQILVGFWVSSVTHIHRLSWKQVEPPSNLVQSKGGYAVGIVKLGEKILFLLDFEKITSDVNPRSGLSGVSVSPSLYANPRGTVNRSLKTVLVAEDSTFIRDLILEHLTRAGYKAQIASNGLEAWNYLTSRPGVGMGAGIEEHIQLVITDIEMPQMDGLHLIKKIREHEHLKKMPCIVFSSMVTAELAAKCRAVGANGEISKPQIGQLVELVDTHVL